MKTMIANGMVWVILFMASSAYAGPHDRKIQRLLDAQINAWLQDPLVVNSIKEQNARHATLLQADINRLDKQWRAEVKNKKQERPLIDGVLDKPLSKYLRQVAKDGEGLYAEIFIMDNKGLNVGQNKATSDYWQGDEAKWQKTFLVGPGSLFVDKIKYDESAERFQIQVSVPVIDPETNAAIGAATIGLAMNKLALKE